MLDNTPELPKKELLSLEKEMLGLYVSGHPLEPYREMIENYSTISSLDFASSGEDEEEVKSSELIDGQYVKFIGIISEFKKKVTKNNDIMAFLTVEDLNGAIPVIAFSRVYEGYRNAIEEDAIVKIEGRVNIREDEVTVSANKIIPCELVEIQKRELKINIPSNMSEEKTKELREFIKKLGNVNANQEVLICNGERQNKLKLVINDEIEKELINKIGKENVIWE